MKKVIALEVIVVLATLAVVLPLAFTGQSSYAGYQAIDWNNASRALTFDLQTGQTVTGWLNYTGEKHGAWFLIGDPNGNEIGSRTNEGDHGTFVFTANIDGQYFIDIGYDSPSGTYIYYSYSISAPPILGVDRTVLTGMVITIGIVLALTIAVWNLRQTRIKKGRQVTFSEGQEAKTES
jgi:hypothetical protein